MEASMDRKSSQTSSKASTAQEATIQSLGKTIKNEDTFSCKKLNNHFLLLLLSKSHGLEIEREVCTFLLLI
jgi:hypothetical protein